MRVHDVQIFPLSSPECSRSATAQESLDLGGTSAPKRVSVHQQFLQQPHVSWRRRRCRSWPTPAVATSPASGVGTPPFQSPTSKSSTLCSFGPPGRSTGWCQPPSPADWVSLWRSSQALFILVACRFRSRPPGHTCQFPRGRFRRWRSGRLWRTLRGIRQLLLLLPSGCIHGRNPNWCVPDDCRICSPLSTAWRRPLGAGLHWLHACHGVRCAAGCPVLCKAQRKAPQASLASGSRPYSATRTCTRTFRHDPAAGVGSSPPGAPCTTEPCSRHSEAWPIPLPTPLQMRGKTRGPSIGRGADGYIPQWHSMVETAWRTGDPSLTVTSVNTGAQCI